MSRGRIADRLTCPPRTRSPGPRLSFGASVTPGSPIHPLAAWHPTRLPLRRVIRSPSSSAHRPGLAPPAHPFRATALPADSLPPDAGEPMTRRTASSSAHGATFPSMFAITLLLSPCRARGRSRPDGSQTGRQKLAVICRWRI